MFKRMFGEELGGLLSTTTKVVAAIGVLSFMAATWASKDSSDPKGLIARVTGGDRAKLAELASRSRIDPTTTGSVLGFDGARINNGRIDPCGEPKRGR
jgi:hypothetical protein